MMRSRQRGQRVPTSWARSAALLAAGLLAVSLSGCGSDRSTVDSATAAAPSPTTWCPSTASLLIRRNSVPSQICLRAGSVLTLKSDGIIEAPWQDIVSSNGAVLQCTSRRGKGGTVSGTCTANAPGMSQVTTDTRAAGGSTNGPGDNLWALTVTVVT